MIEWFQSNETLLWWIAVVSALTFVGTLALMPVLVARIPTDYFAHERRDPSWRQDQHPAVRAALVVAKNALGVVLVAAGLAMLFLPGQGLVTMLIGIMLMNFPGKYRLERMIISQPPVLRAVNWLRARTGREALRVDGAAGGAPGRR